MEIINPKISVIIPHLNQAGGLEECLRCLDAQSLDPARYEVIVVDNGSASSPEAIVTRHRRTRLVHEWQPGPGPARNAGIKAAIGDVFAFIDADCRADPEWLRSALATLCASPERTILGGDVRIWRSDQTEFTAIEAYEGVFAYRFKLYIEQQGFAGTGNLVVRRADFEKIGQFAGIQFAEDMEWGQRARQAGFQFRFVPEMIVFHPARCSLHELYAKWDRQIQHYLHMARGRPAWKTKWILRALAILVSPIVDSVRVIASDRIQGPSARLKAILVLFAIRTHRARKMLNSLGANKPVVWNRDKGI
ncbi:glycosyltransferase involved in cell wall biosynthesis [Nitrobacteraceae bacterium AZCC 2146]